MKVIKEKGRLFICGSGKGTSFHHERKRDAGKVAKEEEEERACPSLPYKQIRTHNSSRDFYLSHLTSS